MNDTDEKIIDLQTRLAFLEDSIDAMNRVIARQQQEVDKLQNEIITLKELIEELRENNVASTDELQHEVPPHY